MSNVLRPVDVNVDRSPLRKRARYDEDVDDLNKNERWSLHKNEVVLHEIFDHGVGRLDCDDEEIFTDDDTIFCKTEPGAIDVSCASMTPNTRDKQLSILESTLTKESLDKLSLGEWDSILVTKPIIKPTDKTNYFDLLSDEVILYILRWLPKTYLMDIALVCKRFHRLTQDESLWTRMDVSNRHLQAGELGKIMSKQVVVLRLARSSVKYPPILPGVKAALPDFKSRLLYLDLSMAYISPQSLTILLSKCRRLKKLSLENVQVNDEVLIALSANKDIEVINFAMAAGMMEDGFKYLLANCRKIRELNLAWTYLNTPSIQYICKNLPSTMDRLNLSGCRKLLTDKHVFDLVSSCPRLRELDLSDCTSITGEAVERLTVLEELNFLALSRCYLIPYKSLLYLKKIYNLSYLDIHGGYNDADELRTIQEGLGAKVQINKFKFSSIARPTVGMRRSSIWNMRVRD
ncbi:S-phase kinase-associated protein 2 [Diorhabda carinulata]|uniref:S-phase kinase-associated protein 2 n=1 Tax=Diorhabda sublineata TaxID=1163346 RepID=UPI0024E0BA12|nr:S-phase kinase-associated protein 2 [Diorhabda sublineata]XP_057651485.1 S-phase kinase-associated protein 2 [Diorhabda carinulata]